jgi:AraC-like DNA-binding protein
VTADERATPTPARSEVDELADLLEGLSRRLAAIDRQPVSVALAGEMARSARQAQHFGSPLLDLVDAPVEGLDRVCRHALRVAATVYWAEIAVPLRGGATLARSAGAVAAATVQAAVRGPRAAAVRSGAPVAIDDVAVDPRWPALRETGDRAPASVLVVPLGVGTGGTLTLAASVVRAFDPAVRVVAAELGHHAGRLVAAAAAGLGGKGSDPAGRAHDTIAAARVLLARRSDVTTDAAFEALLDRAARTGSTLLACAEEVVDELGPPTTNGSPPEPATLRRALAYLEEHAGEDVEVADVAAAAGVGVRGLQMVFRRWRDTTPLGALRDIRLARAHEDLKAADARDGVTVADVIARWHFTHPGRFSVTYRRRYGCSPSETLRS